MPGVDLIHPQEALVPAFLPLSRVVEEGCEGGIGSPRDPARAARGEIVADVQPLV